MINNSSPSPWISWALGALFSNVFGQLYKYWSVHTYWKYSYYIPVLIWHAGNSFENPPKPLRIALALGGLFNNILNIHIGRYSICRYIESIDSIFEFWFGMLEIALKYSPDPPRISTFVGRPLPRELFNNIYLNTKYWPLYWKYSYFILVVVWLGILGTWLTSLISSGSPLEYRGPSVGPRGICRQCVWT